MSEWQPIETAPKDGTRVLLIDENDPTPEASCTGWWMEGYWRDYGDIGCNGQRGYEPTHWMPLPFGPGATISAPTDGWTPGREITDAQLEAACGVDFVFDQHDPRVDPKAAWGMLGEQYKPEIRARVRAVLEAGRRGRMNAKEQGMSDLPIINGTMPVAKCGICDMELYSGTNRCRQGGTENCPIYGDEWRAYQQARAMRNSNPPADAGLGEKALTGWSRLLYGR